MLEKAEKIPPDDLKKIDHQIDIRDMNTKVKAAAISRPLMQSKKKKFNRQAKAKRLQRKFIFYFVSKTAIPLCLSL